MNKALKVFLVAFVTAIGVVAVLWVLFHIVLAVFFNKLPDGEASRKHVQTAYERIALPAALAQSRKDPIGDSLDSPDEFGWEYSYNYTTVVNNQALADSYIGSLKAAGYDVGDTSVNERKSIEFSATSTSQNMEIYALFGTTNATITADVLEYKK